jgi:8-oxo-dGTP pyrophosphatase MutT (NUDIX family)
MPHIHEKIDFTVEVFIVHKNKVLLRMHDKFKYWCSVGGHIELDEDPIEAAYREVKEEVGLEIKIIGDALPLPDPSESWFRPLIAPRFLARFEVDNIYHEHVCLVYFATTDTNEISSAYYEHEKSDVRWVTIDEIDTIDPMPANIRFYAREALKALAK